MSNWYKKAQKNIDLNIYNDCYDYHSGENYCSIIAEDKNTGKRIGYIDYSIYDNEIYIKIVRVEDEYKRRGIGTKMIEFLKNIDEDIKNINLGYSTDEGTPFIESLKERKIL